MDNRGGVIVGGIGRKTRSTSDGDESGEVESGGVRGLGEF